MPPLPARAPFGAAVFAFAAASTLSTAAAAQGAPDAAPTPPESLPVEAAPPTPDDATPPPEPEPKAAAPAAEEVRVRGAATDTLPAASGSGTLITAKELARAQPQSAGEMLRRVPSLNVRQEDPMGLRLNIGVRGLNPSRSRLVLVEEDGVPVVVSPYGEPELYFSTPVERIQTIDVIKGPGVLMYGPQTVGGVVNFHTLAAPDHEDWNVSGEVGQRSYGKALASYGNAVGDVRYIVQVVHKEGDGFRNMPFHTNDFMGKLVFPTSAVGEATLKLSAYDELSRTTYVGLTQPVYEANPRQDTIAPNDFFGLRRYEASLTHDWRFATQTHVRAQAFAYTTLFRLRQQDFDRARMTGVDYERIVGPGDSTGGTIFFRNTSANKPRTYEVAGAEITVDQKFSTFGIEHKALGGARILGDVARRQELSGPLHALSGEMRRDDKTTIYGLAAYLQDTIAVRENVVLVPAVRVEHSISRRTIYRTVTTVDDVDVVQDVKNTGTTTSTGVMPGVQAIVGSPRWNGFAGFHLGYSAPRISASITPDGQDAGLDAERSRNFEIGTRTRPFRWIRGEMALFYVSFSNQLISNNTLTGNSAEFKNGGATRHVGGEGSLTAQIGRGLKLPMELDVQGQYTYSQSRFVGGIFDNNFVPYAPVHTASATIDGELPMGLGAQVAWNFEARQYADEINLETPDASGRAGRIPAYVTFDVAARYRHAKTGLAIKLTVKNLTDQVYLSGRLPNGIFTAGFRQAFVGISWTPATPDAAPSR